MLIYSLAPLLHLMLFSGLLGLWILLFYRPDRRLEELATRLGAILAIFYLVWVTGIIIEQKQIPVLNLGQMLAFLAAMIWWGQNFVQRRVRQRMLVILPLSVVVSLLATSLIFGLPQHQPQTILMSNIAAFHIVLSMAGIAFLLGSGVFGAGQLLLHNQIKTRRFGRFFGYLPSLSDLYRLRRLTLFTGWLLISISMVSAIVWMVSKSSELGPVISHLHPMLTLWVIVSFVTAADRFNWSTRQRLALTSAILSLLVLILLLISVIEIYSRGLV